MRSSVVVSVLTCVGLAAAGLLDERACKADNCLRALTGTGSNERTSRPIIAKSDCSTYLSTLVYTTLYPTITSSTTVPATSVTSTTTTTVKTVIVPDTATSTATKTITDTITEKALFKRTIATIPTYASACSGSVRYSSACSCFGVLPTISTSTIYVSATTTITYTSTTETTALITETDTTSSTSTTTVDVTTTATAEATALCTIFVLYIEIQGSPGIVDYFTDNRLFLFPLADSGAVFKLDPSGKLIDAHSGHVTVVDSSSKVLSTVDPSNIPAGSAPITCQIALNNAFTCQEGSFTIFEEEPDPVTMYGQLALTTGSVTNGIVITVSAFATC